MRRADRLFQIDELARRARSLLSKIESVVPERLKKSFGRPEWHVWRSLRKEVRKHIESLRRAIDERRKLRFDYIDEKGAASTRTVRPLCLAFWGPVWTAGAWCELRADFRSFRPDRMQSVELLDERFRDEPDKDLAAFLRRLQERMGGECAPGRGADAGSDR